MKKYGENGENMMRIGSCSGEVWPKIQNSSNKWQLMLSQIAYTRDRWVRGGELGAERWGWDGVGGGLHRAL